MTIELRRLEHSEINLLRELRNANSDAFFDGTHITPEMQEDWWYRYTFDAEVQFHTIWSNEMTPVGFLSVTFLGDHYRDGHEFPIAEIGNLLLAPAHRGRGIMTKALIEVRRLYSPLTFWIAHVKEGNDASLRLFKRAGFWKVEKGERKCEKSRSSVAV